MYIKKGYFNDKKVIYSGDNSIIYDLGDGTLAKVFININDQIRDIRIKKIEEGLKLPKIDYLVTPSDILEDDSGVIGYIMDKVNAMDFVEHFNNNSKLDLEEITTYINGVEDIVKKCHNYDMVFPDLASGNTLYNPNTKEVYLTDFEGVQLGTLESTDISTFIYLPFHRIINSRKYNRDGLYTKELDMFTLAVRYFYYTTKIDLGKNIRNKHDLKEILDYVGIRKTEYADLLLRAFDYDLSNGYIGESIKELNKRYVLSPDVKTQPRVFMSK